MTLWGAVRVLLSRWYITVAGLLLSLALAGVTFSLVPMQYTSTGTAVLVQPRQTGGPATNPLLDFDSGLSTTALILEQSLSAPETKPMVTVSSSDTFTVENAGSTDVSAQTVQPFLTVVAKSTSSDSASEIVDRVLDLAGQQLNERQRAMHVLAIRDIHLQNVVDATPPKPVLGTPLAATAAAFILGMLITAGLALLVERFTARRAAGRREAFRTRAQEELTRGVVSWPQAGPDEERPRAANGYRPVPNGLRS